MSRVKIIRDMPNLLKSKSPTVVYKTFQHSTGKYTDSKIHHSLSNAKNSLRYHARSLGVPHTDLEVHEFYCEHTGIFRPKASGWYLREGVL